MAWLERGVRFENLAPLDGDEPLVEAADDGWIVVDLDNVGILRDIYREKGLQSSEQPVLYCATYRWKGPRPRGSYTDYTGEGLVIPLQLEGENE